MHDRESHYLRIVRHYETCLQNHGDSHLGVDWPNLDDAIKRYEVMLDVIREPRSQSCTLLDFGCGASHLYEHIRDTGRENIRYAGLDISEKFIELSAQKFPANTYYCTDVLSGDVDLPKFDYVVMNGVFTEKCDLAFEEMFDYFKRMTRRVFRLARRGISFNVMSKHVDWERDDLFHLPFDLLAAFLRDEVTRHFVFRNDYGLFEYTAYAYHQEGGELCPES